MRNCMESTHIFNFSRNMSINVGLMSSLMDVQDFRLGDRKENGNYCRLACVFSNWSDCC